MIGPAVSRRFPHIVLDPLTFLERLCALVPQPRHTMLTYHSVLAPAAGMRDRVVPPPLPDEDDRGCDPLVSNANASTLSPRVRHARTPPPPT
ncbi:MAG: hypothetical protein ABL997_03985, partial [Planctomycetota bacterium]